MIIQPAELAGVQSPANKDLPGNDIAAENQQIDGVVRRLKQLTRTGPAAYAPKRRRGEANAPLASELTPPPPFQGMPSVRLPPSFEYAVAEIVARQRVLNSRAAPGPQQLPESLAAAPPAQDMSGLEGQLRKITTQIETLRKPDGDAFSRLEHRIAVLADTLAAVRAQFGGGENPSRVPRVNDRIRTTLVGSSEAA